MPEILFNKDFSAGWCPSDDPVSGRPNALLQMDNLELDHNGALSLIGGTVVLNPAYPAAAHTLYSVFINGSRKDYAALSDGSVYRNDIQIVTGGDTTNAAFNTAFNFTLICSGSQRYKDDGTTLFNLGILPPPGIPRPLQSTNATPVTDIGYMQANVLVVTGTYTVQPYGSPSVPNQYVQCTTNPGTGIFAVQTYYVTPPVPYPFDATILSNPSSGLTGTGTDDDLFILNGYTNNPQGVSLQIDFLLEPPDNVGNVVRNFYTFSVLDLATGASFDTVTGQFTIKVKRSEFERAGSNAVDWSTIYGFRLTINNNLGTGTNIVNVWGFSMGNPWFELRGGSNALSGTYQYRQVFVNNTGSYIAKSVAGPVSSPIQLDMICPSINVQDPTMTDPQCNENWIYRSGGNLGGTWYRIAVVKAPWAAFYDTMSDQAALELNIQLNINLVSIAATSITDKIFDILGPIQGRYYYFTTNFMYPSDINDPDLVDPNLAIRTCGSSSELYMWARTVSASVVIVGTSLDAYLLTGTFSTFPDGTIDVYYQSVSLKFPPITYDAVSYGGSIYYLGTDGWRFVVPTSFGTTYANQNNQLIVAPNLDRLYKGEICNGYQPPTHINAPGSVRYPVVIAKNKLYCYPAGTGRAEIYDFLRQYWRTSNYGLGDVSATTMTQDGKVIAFYKNDRRLREVETVQKLIDLSGQQDFRVGFTYKDNGQPRQRKDTYTFKARCYTGLGSYRVIVIDERGVAVSPTTTLTSPINSTEVFLDLSQPLGTFYPPGVYPKAYQIILYGTLRDILIEDWSIHYDLHPVPLTFLKIQPSNLGSPTQKRVRTWPLIIDTRGKDVTFTPNIDGADHGPASIFNSDYKKTHLHYFTDDVFGTDYGGKLYDPTGLMEVWSTGVDGGAGNPGFDIVQNLPMSVKFDQVGPLEIFRWGKIVRMALRTNSTGTPIPFKIYLGDTIFWTGQFDVAPGKEDEYIVDLPKGVSGRILRVELGPTSFTFNRYFMKFQVAISGSQADTELAWLTVPGLSSSLAQGI